MDVVALIPADQWNSVTTWINTFFEVFDYKILEFYNSLHTGSLGHIFDTYFEAITHLGDTGIAFIILGLIFLLFKKTRKAGMGVLIAMLFGLVFTNIGIKELVERPRPYATTELYNMWWTSVGHGLESEFSFPSGHTTSAMAAMLPCFLYFDKKKSWLFFIAAILMGASRNYVMVHFPSDILAGLIVGAIAGILAFLIVNFVYKKLSENDKIGKKIVSFDLAEVIKSRKKA